MGKQFARVASSVVVETASRCGSVLLRKKLFKLSGNYLTMRSYGLCTISLFQTTTSSYLLAIQGILMVLEGLTIRSLV